MTHDFIVLTLRTYTFLTDGYKVLKLFVGRTISQEVVGIEKTKLPKPKPHSLISHSA
jgi:hypothetical protein